MSTLEADKNTDNRVVAAAILANFPDADAAWFALVRALRDPQEMVGSVAGRMLAGMAAAHARRIDWSPVKDDLRYSFGGTNVWQMKQVIDVLNATQVSATLAAPILRRNAELLALLRCQFCQGSFCPSAGPAQSPERKELWFGSGRLDQVGECALVRQRAYVRNTHARI